MTSRQWWTRSIIIPMVALAACGQNTLDAAGPELALKHQAEEEGPSQAGTSDGDDVVSEPVQIIVRPSAELWPPNHTMRAFRLSDCAVVNATSGLPINLDQNGRITYIYSDEPEDAHGGGDGDTLQDIVITGPSSFQLRGESEGGGTGRAYGVNFDVRDNSGVPVGHGFCRFLVPRDGSGRPVTDEGPSAGYTVYFR